MDPKASRRYAKSLILLAEELKKLDAIESDMKLILELGKASKDLKSLLHSPLIKATKKNAILGKIFEGKVDKLSLRFLQLLVSKQREVLTLQIAEAFLDQLRALRGISKAEITTALKLDEPQRKKILDLIKNRYGKAEVTEIVKPSVIGGFSIRVGDQLYDKTLARAISDLKKDYLDNPYVPQL